MAVTVRILPDGHPIIETGRAAQTLLFLMNAGAHGATTGDMSPMRWARRVSHYVWLLRRDGFVISTERVDVGDATVALYRLESPVEIVSGRGDA